jgi:hypothetical protein
VAQREIREIKAILEAEGLKASREMLLLFLSALLLRYLSATMQP